MGRWVAYLLEARGFYPFLVVRSTQLVVGKVGVWVDGWVGYLLEPRGFHPFFVVGSAQLVVGKDLVGGGEGLEFGCLGVVGGWVRVDWMSCCCSIWVRTRRFE